MVERNESVSSVISKLETELPRNLPTYTRTSLEDWSRKMQLAAFGSEAKRVTEDQCQSLIDRVRLVRAFLKDNGRPPDEHPDYAGTGHAIYWLKDSSEEPPDYELSVELSPWEQSSGKHLEPYPKFSFDYHEDYGHVHFDLNFDDTYNFLLRKIAGPRNNHLISFEISDLSRREMTQEEDLIINYFMGVTTEHFGLDL